MNTKTSKSVTMNFFSLSVGQGISQILNFGAIALAARYLGVTNLGIFSSLLAIVLIASTLVDFGFAPIAFRQNSKNNDFQIINTAINIRLFSLLILGALFNIFVHFTALSSLEILLLNLLMLNILFSSKIINIRSLLEIPFKSALRMQYPMLFNIVDNLILLILVMFMPVLNAGILYFVIVYLISNLPGFVAMLVLLKRQFNFKISFSFQNSKYLIKESLPIYGYVILNALYTQLDILLLRYLNTNYEVGIYSVSTRLTMPLNIIPAAVTSTVLPLIISNIANESGKNEKIFRFVSKLLYLIAFAFSVVITFKAQSIIVILFGQEYASADMATIILAWTQIFIFFSFFTMELLSVYGKQKYTFPFSFVLLFFGLAFDFLLIPGYSLVGAAYAKFLASVIGFFYMMWILNKSQLYIFPKEFRVILYSLVVLVFQYLFSFLPVVVYLVLSCLNICLSAYFLKFFNTDETLLILKLIKKEHWKEKIRL